MSATGHGTLSRSPPLPWLERQLRSRLPQEWSSDMQRRSFKEIAPLDQRLTEQAERLRKEARGTPPGVKRDGLIRQARQAETASQMQWLSSPSLQPPR